MVYDITLSTHRTILARGQLILKSEKTPQNGFYLTEDQLHEIAFQAELGLQDCKVDDIRIRVHISIPLEDVK